MFGIYGQGYIYHVAIANVYISILEVNAINQIHRRKTQHQINKLKTLFITSVDNTFLSAKKNEKKTIH